MRNFIKYIGLILAVMVLASCGSSGGGGGDSSSSGTSSITIAIGSNGSAMVIEQKEETLFAGMKDYLDVLTPSEAVAQALPCGGNPAVPFDVYRIIISISGDGIPAGSPIKDDIILPLADDHCSAVIRTYTVPNGAKVFSATAEDDSGNELYAGSTPKNINGADYVQIIMQAIESLCDLFVSEIDGIDGENDCRLSSLPCRSITHALNQTDGNETICVAEGRYEGNSNNGPETFPLELRPGTTILCEGSQHGAEVYVDPGETGFQGGQIEGFSADGASIIGCAIFLSTPFSEVDFSIGIDDLGSDIAVDNVVVRGDETSQSVGVNFSGNSSITNSELTCSGIDLFIGIASVINATNNAWDNDPVYIFVPEEVPCPFDGTDICVGEQVDPDITGATQAAGGCLRPEPCNPTTTPETVCNGFDDDCDGSIDEDYVAPVTNCGIGACATTGLDECIGGVVVDSCTPLAAGTEGPPDDPTCSDETDNDCDGLTDLADGDCDVSCIDLDGDGYFGLESSLTCPNIDDCNDGDPNIHPGATEVCDGVDNDCDQGIDEGLTFDVDNDGYSTPDSCEGTQNDCDDRPNGADGIPGNVDDGANIHPDLIDNNCDGVDNDCANGPDDAFVTTFTGAECGVGLCAQPETLECQSGELINVCTPLDPVAEGFTEGPFGDISCENTIDDDCDGFTDAADPDCEEAVCFLLLTPSFEASVENPDLTACPAGTTRDWSFSWSGCPGDTSYELEIYEPGTFGGTPSFVHATSTTSFIHSTSTPSFIPTDMLSGWIWRVRSIISGAFSESRPFNVDPPTACP